VRSEGRLLRVGEVPIGPSAIRRVVAGRGATRAVPQPRMEIVAMDTRERAMTRVLSHAWLMFAGLSLGACAHLGATAHHAYVTGDVRRDAIARAQV
jgi:hypothetical protein